MKNIKLQLALFATTTSSIWVGSAAQHHNHLRKLCTNDPCKKDRDCCTNHLCEGSGNSKTCTPLPIDLCPNVDCSDGGEYATCDPATGQCVCDHDIDTYPNCLGDLPCSDNAECPCDDSIYYPCPSPNPNYGPQSVKGDCTKMECNPNYRGGVGSPDVNKCICKDSYKFQINNSWPSCINCCEQEVAGWANYCYKYPDTNSYYYIPCPVCTDDTDTTYPNSALSFSCSCSGEGTWPDCESVGCPTGTTTQATSTTTDGTTTATETTTTAATETTTATTTTFIAPDCVESGKSCAGGKSCCSGACPDSNPQKCP